MWASDTATHFKNQIVEQTRKRPEGQAYIRGSKYSTKQWNCLVERMIKEIVRCLKAVLQEERRDLREWVGLVPAVQWALNTAYGQRYTSTPCDVMFGRAPITSFSTIASATSEDWQVHVLDDEGLKRKVT